MTKSILRITGRLLFISISLAISVSVITAQSMFDRINDFDGDGRADFVVTRDEGGLKIWHIWQTTAGYRQVHWGVESDLATPGDYDGDSKTDLAIVRRDNTSSGSTCYFHILRSVGGSYQIRGLPLSNPFESSCTPIQQDYDADGRADPAVWHSQVTGAVSYYRSATNTIQFLELPSMHVPVLVGDLDGDASAEITSYIEQIPRSVRKRNPVSEIITTAQFGTSGDIYVPGDFDGDNVGDLAIFRPSSGDWWWIRSLDGTVGVEHWGLDGDFPVPADYDGDGKTDRAVYRPGTPNGIYYINGSLTGFQVFIWGVPGDRVIRYQR
jgi:hypothetical protein